MVKGALYLAIDIISLGYIEELMKEYLLRNYLDLVRPFQL
jgi:hypothetical protein